MNNVQRNIVAILIVLVALVLAISSFWNDSPIVDEIPHIGAGYSYLDSLDFRLNPEHPPLAKNLGGFPLLFTEVNKGSLYSTRYWQNDVNGQWEFGRFLLYSASPDPDKAVLMMKFPILIFYILTAWLIFQWTTKKYSNFAGFTALIVFLFSPTVMAHARFVTTDLAAAFGIILATFFFLKYLYNQNRKNFWFASIAFGISLLTKFSTFMLVPYLGLVAGIYGLIQIGPLSKKIENAISYGLKSVLIFFVGFLIIVWPVYFIQTLNYPPEKQQFDTMTITSSFTNDGKMVKLSRDGVVWASDKPVIRGASHYALGLMMVFQRATGGNRIYFRGNVGDEGGKMYFPIIYFAKEPLGWWLLAFISLIFTLYQLSKNHLKSANFSSWARKHFTEITMLIWLILYWYTSISSNLNIGVRHILPVFPFSIILVAGQLDRLRKYINGKKLKVLFYVFVVFSLSWLVFANINIWPYYLTYFNSAIGGPEKGYKLAVDSNLDWGQDLKRLGNWTNDKNINAIEVDYFGWADPSYYLKEKWVPVHSTSYVNINDFKDRNRTNGWIAVSATFLMNSIGDPNEGYWWLREIEPEIRIGNSIFVYHIK